MHRFPAGFRFAPRSECSSAVVTARMVLPYRFRTMIEADLPMVERWLRTPEVARWWGDPAEQLALLKEDLDDPLMRQWIVEYGQCPFAYVQAYEAHAWPQVHLQSLPGGTQVIDTFVGEPEMLGRGHGSVFLRLLANILIGEGAPSLRSTLMPEISGRSMHSHAPDSLKTQS